MHGHFFSLQRPDENLDVSLSVPQYNGHPPPPSHIPRYHNLINDQVKNNDDNDNHKKVIKVKLNVNFLWSLIMDNYDMTF